jgi:hypothetical protein
VRLSAAKFTYSDRNFRELSTLQEKLEGLKHQDKSRTKQVFKKIMSVHSDREDIHTCATQLDEAFQLLMVRSLFQ